MKREQTMKEKLPMECMAAEANASGLSGIKKRFRLRPISIASCAFLLILLSVVAIDAMGFNIWHFLYRWDDEELDVQGTFQGKINGEGRENYLRPCKNDAFFQKLAELELYPLMPYRWPEGFSLKKVEGKVEDEFFRWALGSYENGQRLLNVSVDKYSVSSGAFSGAINKDEREPEIYDRGGLRIYIVHNLSRIVAYWLDPPYMVNIGGDISREELGQTLHSMFERK